MTPERWRQIEELFHAASARTREEQAAFLDQACAGDELLRQEVESLLTADNEQSAVVGLPSMVAAAWVAQDRHRKLLGQTMGRYRVVSPLGSGGMGEVFLAEDTSLNRKVALKLLPHQFTEDRERVRRFEQEARAASALNHPNILTIHEIGQFDGIQFIATEFVDGQTLRLWMTENRAFHQSIEVGIQIASALAAAHSAGIVHRDIKPANIMVRSDGLIKVLDFGLAKLTTPSNKELTEEGKTDPGRVMGTVHYMSPEQALGQVLDHRTDIFSLGVVLYEMFSGEQPFQGESDAAFYNALLNRTPPSITDSNPGLPLELERIIKRALEKDRELRYQTATDLRAELKRLERDTGSGQTPLSEPSFQKSGPLFNKWTARAILGSVVVLALIIGWYFWLRSGANTAPASFRNAIFTQLTDQGGPELFPSLLPDGKSFIYASAASGNWDIYLQRVGGQKPTNLTKDSPDDDTQAAFSPDGEHIAFRSERQGGGIFIMGATGESPRRLTDFGYNPAWAPDGKEIICANESITDSSTRATTTSQLWSINVASGEKRLVTDFDAVQPNWSPHRQRIAYWTVQKGGQRDIWTVLASGGEAVPVTNDAAIDWNPVWAPDGAHLYFLSDRGGSMNLWRIAIDEQTGKVLGAPEAITTPAENTEHLSLSHDGRRIAYVQVGSRENIKEANFDPVQEKIIGQPTWVNERTRQATHPFLSPDGEWLVFSSAGAKQEDLFVIKTDGTGLRQLTNDRFKDRLPRWSPDGKRIVFYSDRSGKYEVWTISPDGSGLQQITFTSPGPTVRYPFWSPDSTRLAYFVNDTGTFIIDATKRFSDQTPVAVPAMNEQPSWFEGYSWSPDGQTVAGYPRKPDGSASGIYLYSLQSHQYKKLTDSGNDPIWLSDNRRLLFSDKGNIFLLDSRTKRIHQVLSIPPHSISQFVISKDDRKIYFAVSMDEADVWLMSLD